MKLIEQPLAALRSRFFSKFRKQSPYPTVTSYGQLDSGLSDEQIQALMDWLFPTLINAGYQGRAHLIWYNDALELRSQESEVKSDDYWDTISRSFRRDEPVFLYRCGSKVHPIPEQYYWRLMPEYPTLRMYQFELKQD